MKEPSPDHPIVITPHEGRLRVVVDGTVVADTTRGLSLREARYAPVFYIPREDANPDVLVHNPRTTTCPYKGEASYYDLCVDGTVRAAAVWSYGNPFPAVARIKDHLAFYPDKVDAIEELER